MDWAEKYRPRKLADLVGNGPAVRAMYDWARSWSPGKKPLLLHGKPGTGKTSSAHALASDMGWEIIELNASDQRTKDVIGRIAGSASVTASLTGAGRKLIVFDEADNLHGTADRGGAREILEVIRGSRQPIILIANDLYGIPAEIRSRCDPVLFRAVQARSVVPRLKFICANESLACSDASLTRIAEQGGGDLRASINMLYGASTGKDRVTDGDVVSTGKDDRVSIFDLILSIFKGREDAALLAGAQAADETPDTVLQWIEANLIHIPDPRALALAYRWVSRADEYLGLTLRRQYLLALEVRERGHAPRGIARGRRPGDQGPAHAACEVAEDRRPPAAEGGPRVPLPEDRGAGPHPPGGPPGGPSHPPLPPHRGGSGHPCEGSRPERGGAHHAHP